MRKAVEHLKTADPVLAQIIERVGPFKMQYREPTFEGLARSIVYQQLSGKAASTIYGRVLDACGGAMTPEAVLRLSPERMRELGLSKQKSAYLRDLAEKTASGELEFTRFHEMPDQDVIDHLTAVKGIGVWTVHMFLMFYLRRPNVLPTGDLGIKNAVKRAYRMRKDPKPEDIERRARRWHPYCSIACWYLWRSLELD
jgi:DNA-3-methyladenine glycosylase II